MNKPGKLRWRMTSMKTPHIGVALADSCAAARWLLAEEDRRQEEAAGGDL